jgi:hypothetical protein
MRVKQRKTRQLLYPIFSCLCLAASDHSPADRLQGYTRLHLDRRGVRDASRHSGSAMCLQLHGCHHARVGSTLEKSGNVIMVI